MLSFFCLTEEHIGPEMLKNIAVNQMRFNLSFSPYFALLKHSLRRYHFEYYKCKCKSNEIVIFIILVMIFLLYLTEGLRRSRNVQEYFSKSNEIQTFFFFLFCLTEEFRRYNFNIITATANQMKL